MFRVIFTAGNASSILLVEPVAISPTQFSDHSDDGKRVLIGALFVLFL